MLEECLWPVFKRRDRKGRLFYSQDMFGENLQVAGAGMSHAGRPRLLTRLMRSSLYFELAYVASDLSLVVRWTENVQWQYFSGTEYYQTKFRCDPAQITRFRQILGEADFEELLRATIDAAVKMKAVRPSKF